MILDRVHQARVVNALEPEWEARFESKSYGFRPGRGCHDAIESIYLTAAGKSAKRRWILDADLAGAFDRIAHQHLMLMLGSFPARGMIRRWLKAGVVENGRLHRTEEGTPQGGVISPVLLNIALHGMEQAAGVAYLASGSVRLVARGAVYDQPRAKRRTRGARQADQRSRRPRLPRRRRAIVVDYKTDKDVTEDTAEQYALKHHAGQGEVYAQGLSTATGLNVREVVFVYCKAGAEVRLRDGTVMR